MLQEHQEALERISAGKDNRSKIQAEVAVQKHETVLAGRSERQAGAQRDLKDTIKKLEVEQVSSHEDEKSRMKAEKEGVLQEFGRG